MVLFLMSLLLHLMYNFRKFAPSVSDFLKNRLSHSNGLTLFFQEV